MSNIIWKNKNSDDIKGLLIRELPPITKPKMRTVTTEIDGKDGDTVDYLGYKSYTKSIAIGLTRNYDIDEIMNFFNGKSKLILSNEPDKYYTAEIIDSIDYTRLINFKTANVKFHVQPYKYLVDEKIVQNRNLLILNKESYTKNGVSIINNGDGTITLNGTTTERSDFWFTKSDSNNTYPENKINFIKGDKFTFSVKRISGDTTFTGGIIISSLDSNDVFVWNDIAVAKLDDGKNTTQMQTNGVLTACRMPVPKGIVFDNLRLGIQLEKGDVAHSFEGKSIIVNNIGYETSKPVITIYGFGEIQFQVNGFDVFSVNIEDEYITIDAMQEEAYCGSVLRNRQMTGSFPKLLSGINVISWTGNVTKIEVHPKSRWL